MIKPTTSSIMAADVNTTPRRVEESPLVPKMVNVVSRLVEHNAAPAANACNDDVPIMGKRKNDSPMGTAMPMAATPTDKNKLAFKDLNEVASPPESSQRYPRTLLTNSPPS